MTPLSWSRAYGAYLRKSSRILFKRPFLIKAQQPLISFTFDDFPESALHIGGSILRRYNLAGTYYASLGLMGTDAPAGRIFATRDLKLLRDQGHELGCHTFSHCDSGSTATRAFEQAILDNREALANLLPGITFRTFAYPIACPRPLTKYRASKHFLCCRGGGQTFNTGIADLNNLSAYFLEKARNRIEQIQHIIACNNEAFGWLIFATHDISVSPTPYGCTPEFFEDVVHVAVSSGACILPVVDALQTLVNASGLDLLGTIH